MVYIQQVQRGSRILDPRRLDQADGAKVNERYWLTPPDLYARLDAEFHFDFDPCPFPRPPAFNGLWTKWGQMSYVNFILRGNK